jgi:hypothetical protein
MSADQIFALGRVVERLLICMFGGISLVLGWNLFRVGVVTQQTADLAAKGWRLNLKRVGPGVFFALFGTLVLSLSLRSPLTLPLQHVGDTTASEPGGQQGKNDGSTVTYAHGDDPELVKSWVASINTIERIATKDKFATLSDQQSISRSEKTLSQLREALIVRQFGAALFQEYQTYEKKKSMNPDAVTDQDQRRFAGIDAWMRADRIQE